ncbi:DUF1003 domain-containing protein [Tessaracoccus sp. OS52]|uniref:DUF1003 domain-containing protein n=1 Tax=Tessaracoccus sp. OS52 TaxID=2886691 RepID=UPI001D0FA498|nr:DUF1003 domain-containing protein [Tessaracoccus sp. OS52]MCC2593490.1 DUF1003 domain-containing protein [Tessaracoccus sp. OS52]
MAGPERERDLLSVPGRRRSWFPTVQLDSETFGKFAESFARFMGTAKFLLYMTIFVIVWVLINLIGLFGLRWDPYPFILLNLFFSTQASYSAPLILLAQNRQEVRDKLSLDEDREVARQSRADMDFLAREIAAIRMSLGELATRDFVRGELRNELRDLEARLQKVGETDE